MVRNLPKNLSKTSQHKNLKSYKVVHKVPVRPHLSLEARSQTETVILAIKNSDCPTGIQSALMFISFFTLLKSCNQNIKVFSRFRHPWLPRLRPLNKSLEATYLRGKTDKRGNFLNVACT